MISIETAFNELGTDAITGTQLMGWLNLSPMDFSDPGRFQRFKEVIDYFKGFEEDTQRFLIVRATNGKMIPDKLNHVWEYTQLLGTRKTHEDVLTSIEKERSILGENPDPLLKSSVDMRALDTREKIAKLNQEIQIYEK